MDERPQPSGTTAGLSLGVYALTHAVVDAACATLLWRAVHDGVVSGRTAVAAFLAYNFFAFAVQPLVGLGADRLGAARGAAAVGALTTAAAVPASLLSHGLAVAIVLAGLGNAVFHIGGGIVSLTAARGRATPPGIFVAPGAAGVAWGVVHGRGGGSAWPPAVALVVLAVVLALAPRPRWRTTPSARRSGPVAASAVETILVLLLFVIALRAYVGMALVFPWKSQMPLLVALTAGVVLGKALGGVAADRWGWRPVGVGAIALSVPLLALGPDLPVAGIAGALVFNMTMPVTLVAAAAALPRHEGFAFGLTCLALFVGTAPALLRWDWAAAISPLGLVALAVAAAAALWLALGRLGADPAGDPRLLPLVVEGGRP